MPELRDYQRQAVDALLAVRRGIVKSPAGSGKTFILAAALQEFAIRESRPIKAAVIVNTLEQKDQVWKALALFPAENLSVDVQCYAAAPWVGDCDVVVSDECQHSSAECFRKIFEGLENVVWGVSATPHREDDLKEDVFVLLGPIVFEVKRETLVAAGTLCEGNVTFIECNDFDEYDAVVSGIADSLVDERKKKWPYLFANPASANEQIRRCVWQAVLQEAINNNPKRDAAVAEVVKRHPGETVLVIVGSVAHGEKLAGLIEGAEIVHAKLGKKKRAEIMGRFSSGELKVLVSTSLADEGLDIPRASVLVLAVAGKSSNKAEQRTGRVLRTFGEKTHGSIFDFNDISHSYLRAQAMKRMKTYEKLGYSIAVEKIMNEPEPCLSKAGYIPKESPMVSKKTPSIKVETVEPAPVSIIVTGSSAWPKGMGYTTSTSAAAAPLAHAERAHSRHSPSSLEPILRCAGFLNDPTGDKTAADRGTLGHEAVEKRNPDLCKDDESLRKAVNRCIKYIDRLAKGCDKHLVEQRVKILDQSGSFDHLIIKGNEADLADLKFAFNRHEASSLQFKAYVVGVFEAYPTLLKITVHAVHPFLGEAYTETFTRGDYDYLVAEVRAVIERARKADPADYRINRYCGYCGRAGSCPVLGKIAKELAERYTTEEYTLPEGSFDVHGSDFKDPEKAVALLKLAGPVEKAAESWRRGAMRLRMEEGVDLPGYDLVIAKGRRSVTNAPAAYEAIKGIISPEEFIQISSVPIGKLEDLYGSKAPKGKKAAYVAALNDKLADVSAISEGASVPKLVQKKGAAA